MSTTDPRKFCASFSVRIGTQRVRFELSPAADHGGPEGTFRVRLGRRWLDSATGEPLFLGRDSLAGIVADAAFGALPDPAPMPDVPSRACVSVRRVLDGEPRNERGWTLTPPILAANGRWMVAVTLFDGVAFVPVDSITLVRRAA